MKDTMQVYGNGSLMDIPVSDDGFVDPAEVHRRLGGDQSRALVLQRPDGRNEVVNPGTPFLPSPGDRLLDLPITIRGRSA